MAELAAAFEAQAERVGATVHRTPNPAAVPTALRILQQAGCRSVALAGGLRERFIPIQALQQAGLVELAPNELSPTRRADGGISVARLGVAETGSVLLHSGAADRRVELCVDVHLVLLDAEAL